MVHRHPSEESPRKRTAVDALNSRPEKGSPLNLLRKTRGGKKKEKSGTQHKRGEDTASIPPRKKSKGKGREEEKENAVQKTTERKRGPSSFAIPRGREKGAASPLQKEKKKAKKRSTPEQGTEFRAIGPRGARKKGLCRHGIPKQKKKKKQSPRQGRIRQDPCIANRPKTLCRQKGKREKIEDSYQGGER